MGPQAQKQNRGRRVAGGTEVAFALMVFATFLFPLGDGLAKALTRVVGPLEVSFWRLAFQTLVLFFVAGLLPKRMEGTLLSPALVGAGVALATSSACLIVAYSVMPLATAIAIFFVEPLILTVLSAVLLGERTGWRRYIAVAIGLLGSVVVIRPNWSSFGVYSILPLAAACAFAVNMILIRLASRTHSSLTIQCGISLFSALAMALAVLIAASTGLAHWSGLGAPGYVWPLYLLMGILTAATFLSIAEAFRRLPASTLAPLQYLEIVGATLLGYVAFGDFPDLLTWVGTAIILLSGIYVIHGERAPERKARRSA